MHFGRVTFISCIIESSLILKKIGLDLKKLDLQRLHIFGKILANGLCGYFLFFIPPFTTTFKIQTLKQFE